MTRTTLISHRLMTRLLVITILGCLGGSRTVRADLVAFDSFNYTPGQALAGMNGGTGFAGAWQAGPLGPNDSSSYMVQSTSLGGSPNAATDGRVSSLAQYSLGSGLTRELATPIGQAGTTVYMSMQLRADGTINEGASGGFFGVMLNASTTTPTLDQDLFVGKTGDGNFGIEDRGGGNSHQSSTAAAIGVSDFLVVRADFAASGPDKFTLYVNPTGAALGEGIVKQDSELGLINSLSIYSTGSFSLDDLRIGTSLGDVMPAGITIVANAVPEPASVIMLSIAGLGAVALARLRSRRQNGIA